MKHYNYTQAKFHVTVNDLEHFPVESLKEIAIVGRSNSGKSTLINTLTNQTRLAFTSKTPGRTQHINYFSLLNEHGIFLVDLPGYGYAKVPEKIRKHWEGLLAEYLAKREPLIGLIIIMDSRRPLKELDYAMLDFFAATNKPVHVVLSKVDKLNQSEKQQCLNFVKAELAEKGYTNYTVQLFSAPKRQGIPELESTLDAWLTD